MTPDRINTLSLVNDADKASELFTKFRKRDDELIKDARNGYVLSAGKKKNT